MELQMLVLGRRKDESIMIGDGVEVVIVSLRGDKVDLGVKAPKRVPVHRGEIYDVIQSQEPPRKAPDGSE
jgi:carbon storage regulator